MIVSGTVQNVTTRNEKDQIFIVETKPSFVAVVYPKTKRWDSKGAQARPGIIQKTPKMSKNTKNVKT